MAILREHNHRNFRSAKKSIKVGIKFGVVFIVVVIVGVIIGSYNGDILVLSASTSVSLHYANTPQQNSNHNFHG